MKAHRFRLLLLAPYCDSTDVGEAWSTFQWVSRLSRMHDVTVITQQRRGRPAPSEQLPCARVVEWKGWTAPKRLERLSSAAKPGYLGFYWKTRRWIRAARDRGEVFDLAHQVSPLAIRYPSPAAGLVRPLVMGPVGGSLGTPESFRSECGGEPWYVRLRGADRWRLAHDPILRGTYQASDLVLGVAPYVSQLLAIVGTCAMEVMSETGVVALPPLPERDTSPGRLRLLYVGRIVRTKGVRDAIRAMGHVRDMAGVTLDVVGDGGDRPACEQEVRELNLTDRVRFHGRCDRAAVDGWYKTSHAFMFPSFREPSGNVVFEAMSWGLPVIAANYGGPGFVVNDSCGFLIRPNDPEQYAADLGRAIRRLAMDSELATSLGRAARERVKCSYLWENKVEKLTALYERVVDRCSGRTT